MRTLNCLRSMWVYELPQCVNYTGMMSFNVLYQLCLLTALLSIARGRNGTATDSTLCGRCQVVANQLYSQLRSEGPRNDIDLRSRLGDDGVRQGKIIKYRISEARVDALLDGLCPALKTYTLDGDVWTLRKGQETAADVHHARTLMNTCTDILHREEERLAAWLTSDDSEDATLVDVVGVLCTHTCAQEDPSHRSTSRTEL